MFFLFFRGLYLYMMILRELVVVPGSLGCKESFLFVLHKRKALNILYSS